MAQKIVHTQAQKLQRICVAESTVLSARLTYGKQHVPTTSVFSAKVVAVQGHRAASRLQPSPSPSPSPSSPAVIRSIALPYS